LNPLLNIGFPIQFDCIRPEHVEPAIESLIATVRQRLADLIHEAAGPTLANTLRPLDTLTDPLDRAMAVLKHLESVAGTPELRTSIRAVEAKVTDFHAELRSDLGLRKRVQQFGESEEAARLDQAQKRFLGRWNRAVREAESAAIQRELATLTTKFAQNVHDATAAFELVVTDGELLGCMDFAAVRQARASAEKKGVPGWRFTLHPSSYAAVMRGVSDASVRERAYRAHVTRAASGNYDNRPLIARILDLRLQIAQSLGYRNFAEMRLSDRMIGSSEAALTFLADLKQRLEPQFLRERAELREYHGRLTERHPRPLQPWDVLFYASRQAGSVEAHSIPPSYFPLEKVMAGLFEIARRLYGIEIREQTAAKTWNPEAKYYTIHDEQGTTLAGFYNDWFPRENKRAGAWMTGLVTGGPTLQGFEPHLAVLCANLTRPTKGWPALLTHADVQTLFHEFGHLLHHCLSRVEFRSLAGINVAQDFLELPSQIMENWCWEREAMYLFAGDYKTGLPVPDTLLWGAARGRKFLNATRQMTQIGISVLDLLLHSSYTPERDGDVVEYSRRVLEPYSLTPLLPEDASVASLTHLFARPVGYAAGYYSYKWNDVLAADAFSQFRARGILDGGIGREFREKILARGGSEAPSVLYRDFMGRDPDPQAFLDREGLSVPLADARGSDHPSTGSDQRGSGCTSRRT